jgi:hypothetical protein
MKVILTDGLAFSDWEFMKLVLYVLIFRSNVKKRMLHFGFKPICDR